MERNLMNRKRNTLIFMILLLLIICVGFLIQKIYFGKSGAVAVIEQDGETISELPLNKDTELVLDDGDGGSNTITVKNGTVAVTDANCPDLVCVHTGSISHTGEVIACLPHKLIITISGDDNSLDAASW